MFEETKQINIMKIEINKADFLDIMEHYRPHGFSLDGLRELYDHLVEIESRTGKDCILNPNKLSSQWEEGSLHYFSNRFGYDLEEYQDMLDKLEYVYVGYPATQFDTLAEISAKQIIVKIL